MAERISDELADVVAAFAGLNPYDMPTHAVDVEYNGHLYGMWARDGKFIGFDKSVYADDGTLITSEFDAWWKAAKDSFTDLGNGVLDTGKTLMILGVLAAIVYIVVNTKALANVGKG